MVRWGLDLIRFLRFSRTITTIPFALGAYVAASGGEATPRSFFSVFLSIVLGALVFLLYNRTYESPRSKHVPRDCERERLFSLISPRLSAGLTVLFVLLFLANAYRINTTAFYLSPVALVAIFSYVPSRYHTTFNHGLLGFIASLLVLGPYVAIRGGMNMEGLIGGAALLFWITGFDVVYSLRDVEKARSHGYVSLPLSRGPSIALYVGGGCQIVGLFCFFAYAVHGGLGDLYLGFMSLVSILVAYVYFTLGNQGHLKLVRRFFQLNVLLSIGFFTIMVLEQLTSV